MNTVILDATPIFDGYTVDTSCAYDPGASSIFRLLDAELPTLRKLIRIRINEGGTFQWIATRMNHLATT